MCAADAVTLFVYPQGQYSDITVYFYSRDQKAYQDSFVSRLRKRHARALCAQWLSRNPSGCGICSLAGRQ